MPETEKIHFCSDHPTAAGHFPGNPIIPGALLLDEVIRTLPAAATGIRAAKFFSPVRPGDSIFVSWSFAPGTAKFECRLAGTKTLVAAGMVETGAEPA